jgi:DNA-binding response OmpR family regulator
MRKKRILIIEDDKTFADIYVGSFTNAGFDVSLAPDGESGLDMVKKGKPDLVILDLMLAKMSGFEVLERLCGDEEAVRCIPTIVVTNLDQKSDRTRALKLGAREYFVKANTIFSDVLESAHAHAK